MELGALRSLVTLLSLVLFVGIVWWAYARRNKSRFDEAARLPLSDD
jgi:cytochrome c oxidase cbb3-type subunit 4